MKKFLVLIFIFALFQSCQSNPPRPVFHNQDQFEMCSMLFDVKDNKMISQIGTKCDVRSTPCSTFKVPLFLFALQDGLISNLNTSFKWDGKKRELSLWNQDQTAESWIKNSTVWVSQQLTKKMGMAKVKEHLDSIKYGNANPYSAIDSFWLTKSTFSINADNSLKISPEEQLDLLNKIWRDKLPGFTSQQTEMIQQAMRLPELDQNGFKFYGKTGSGFVDYDKNKRLGWFIGYVTKDDSVYSLVIRIEDKYPQPEKSYTSQLTKEMAVELVTYPGMFDEKN